jgi:cell fate regulator YaaT (PSP1 superfamily)
MEDIVIKEKGSKQYDCSRGCDVERTPIGELKVRYNPRCCKLSSYNWMEGISQKRYSDLFEVRFKNTRKIFFRNTSGQIIKKGDLVVVEAQNGHDLGIVTLEGPVVLEQLDRHHIDPDTYEFRRIYRKAKILDIERWQEAISREHKTMIRARQLAARLGLDMKIGDVEFQGDGTKAIFYYIADARVDFRQLIKDFAEEFHIRVEMKQIGARQEAGLIGGLGVCGRALCCSNYMSDFQSITTQAARCQDLSLNPQKLAGQCSKLKCCINYEVSTYVDAQRQLPEVHGPIELEDGPAWLMKTDILRGILFFSYEQGSLSNLYPLSAERVREILAENRKGIKSASLQNSGRPGVKQTEFISAVGDDSITRFDEQKKRRNNNRKKNNGRKKEGGGGNRGGNGKKKAEKAGPANGDNGAQK